MVRLLFLALVLIASAVLSEKITSLPGLDTMPSYNMYSGYITLSGGANMFYWFIESENDPVNDPLVLWLNGGPGCSSLSGLLEEHGPFFPNKDGNLDLNPYSWNKVANMLYLESPAGVGYSYWPGVHFWTDNETAALNYEFLTLWFKEFSAFSKNDFYISGESYAGHYIPTLSYEIYIRTATQGNVAPQSNFKGFIVGNPSTHMNDAESSLSRYLQYHAMIPLNEVGIQADGYYDPYDVLVDKCRSNRMREYIRFPHPFNNYLQDPDFFKRYVPNPDPCEDDYVDAYLNREDVRAALHASDEAGTWRVCAAIVYKFGTESIIPYYQTFINNTDYHIVVFSGDADTVVNFVGTEEWILDLDLPVVERWASWSYSRLDGQNDPQVGGWRVKYDGLGFVTVKGAGHMVPWWQPAPALEMFTKYLEGKW